MNTPANRQKLPQLGFWDKELSLPTHDDMQLWCYRNLQLVLRAAPNNRLPKNGVYQSTWAPQYNVVVYDPATPGTTHASTLEAVLSEKPDVIVPPKPPLFMVASATMESVLREGQRILGYADLDVHFNSPLVLSWRRGDQRLVASYLESRQRVLVECKTTLGTLGELMRQLQLYRQVCTNIVLVCPDDQYAEVLAEQGIGFYKYSNSPTE